MLVARLRFLEMLRLRMLAVVSLMALWIFAQTPASDAVTDWIRGTSIPLGTPLAGNGFDDMQPLKKVIGNARIVSLGEATHGTREFFQLKHRMLEFLASEMGFTIFSIEASMPEAYRLNDYVLKGNGDPAQLLRGLYLWPWDTEEVLAMIKWMRVFNQSGKGRIEFTGFDMQLPEVAAGNVSGFVAKYDPDYGPAIQSAAGMAVKTRRLQKGPQVGTTTADFPVSLAIGKTIRFSGHIKTADVEEGFASLWCRVEGANGVLAWRNRQSSVTGTTDWKKVSISVPVARDARNISFGVWLSGSGSAWFDDLEIEVDGEPFSDPAVYDLGFESFPPRGFFTGGTAYRTSSDATVFHSGKQSLSMRRIAPDPNSVDPKVSEKAWQDIVTHLESSREQYRTKDATIQEIEWAVQNARVVLQGVQNRGGIIDRDRSMAENVKWILDHSPDQKIVLWAHNGHVQTSDVGGFKTMGSSLRQMYGDQMVVFGFAFNQGSFQARSTSNNIVKNFTVPPTRPGSLDATLASAGIPLFALPLRHVPPSGPVADWWKEPHQTRSIGGPYPEDSPYASLVNLKATETFDALLFVEKTTAARKNGPDNGVGGR